MDFPLTSGQVAKLPQLQQQPTVNLRQPPSGFTQGQLLQAFVSAKSGDATYLLNIGGREVHAQSTASLQVGQKLDLQVASLTPQVELKIIHDPITKQIGVTLHLLEGKQSLAPLLSQLLEQTLPQSVSERTAATLQTFLQSILPEEQLIQPDGSKLQEVISRLGMNMEQLFAGNSQQEAVQTLKFALLEMSQQPGLSQQQSEQAGQLLQTLELFQMLQIRLQTESLLFLPLPFPFLEQGYVLVDDKSKQQGQNQGKENEPLTFSLHLRLEGLGNLRIEMVQTEGSLDIRFFAESTEKTTFLREHGEELEQWLTSVALNSVQFLSGAEEPGSSLLQRMIGDTTGVIDTQA